jgi:hypothetical protein
MQCYWKDCQFENFPDMVAVEYDGYIFCPFHLPLSSDHKLDATTFSAWLLDLGIAECVGVQFPGAFEGEDSFLYQLDGINSFLQCKFGPAADLEITGTSEIRFDESTALGVFKLKLLNKGSLTCSKSHFKGPLTIDVPNDGRISQSVDLHGSRFDWMVYFINFHKLRSLNLSGCHFEIPPDFTESPGGRPTSPGPDRLKFLHP